MTRILVTNAGRSPAINFCRSAKLSNANFQLFGIDQNAYSVGNAEVEKCYMMPEVNDPQYWPYLLSIIDKHKIDFLYPSKTNEELLYISRRRDELPCKTFLPPHSQIELYEDKWRTFEQLDAKQFPVPETVFLNKPEDLERALARFGTVWLRAISGSGGGRLDANVFFRVCIGLD